MSYESSPGVLIAGAGPVGLSCALALARQGIAVTLIERGPDVYRAPRAMGYHWSALYGLDDLGVLDDMKTRGFLAHGIDMHVLRTGEVVPFSTDPLVGNVAHPYSITLGQDKLAEILIEHLAKYDHVRTLWQTTVTDVEQDDQRVIVTLDSGRRLAAPWLVAADGAASTIRPALGLGFEGVTWPHNFIASNVRFDFSQLGYADNNYVIDPVLGAVLAKVTADGIWRVTWSEDAALPEEGVHERIERFLTALASAGRAVPGGRLLALPDASAGRPDDASGASGPGRRRGPRHEPDQRVRARGRPARRLRPQRGPRRDRARRTLRRGARPLQRGPADRVLDRVIADFHGKQAAGFPLRRPGSAGG